MNEGAPGVDGGPAIALPGIIVASIVDDKVLIRFLLQNIPVVCVVQILVAIIAQVCWTDIHFLQQTEKGQRPQPHLVCHFSMAIWCPLYCHRTGSSSELLSVSKCDRTLSFHPKYKHAVKWEQIPLPKGLSRQYPLPYKTDFTRAFPF